MSLPRADKKLGQHFLKDIVTIEAITTDFTDKCDVIIEVGPGPAILTPTLAAHKIPYHVIEMDTRFEEQLSEHVKKENIHFQDALEFNWEKFIKDNEYEDKKIWLVSNLPYNVGTVLFTQFLAIKEIKYMSLMFQKEVGEKTYIRNIKNEMSGLLFLSQNYFKSKLLRKVAPGCFVPPPKVDSVVVSYERIEQPQIAIEDFKVLDAFCRKLFSNKRKQLGWVLKNAVGFKDLEKLEEIEISSKLRAEALSLKQVYDLYMLTRKKTLL